MAIIVQANLEFTLLTMPYAYPIRGA